MIFICILNLLKLVFSDFGIIDSLAKRAEAQDEGITNKTPLRE
jgi:hypothetical protein